MVAGSTTNAATSNMAQILNKNTQVEGSGTIVINSKIPRWRWGALPTRELEKSRKKSCDPQPFRKHGSVRRWKRVALDSPRVFL